MSSVFSKIIAGEIPGRFVWSDDECVVMATIEPIRPGHVMVIPRAEVENFADVEPETFAHMMKVAQLIGKAQERAFGVPKAVVGILGFEVPHTHVHVVPAEGEGAMDMRQAQAASGEELDAAMERLRVALIELGHEDRVPADMSKN